MKIPKFIKGVAKYFTYASSSGETTPTTQADLQELMKNNNTILECLVDGLWQPEKEMKLNQIIRSPNMPANTVAKVTSVGVTGTTEPEWPETVDTTVSDGSVTFTMSSQQADIKKTTIIDLIYPVGSIYMSVNSTSPADLFGGTWEAMPAGRVLLAQGTSEWGVEYKAGSIGGEHEHQLSVGELPSHNHVATCSTDGNHSHILNAYANATGGGGKGYWFDRSGSLDSTQNAGNHSHTISISNTGNNKAHNIIQPYFAIFIWKRIS